MSTLLELPPSNKVEAPDPLDVVITRALHKCIYCGEDMPVGTKARHESKKNDIGEWENRYIHYPPCRTKKELWAQALEDAKEM